MNVGSKEESIIQAAVRYQIRRNDICHQVSFERPRKDDMTKEIRTPIICCRVLESLGCDKLILLLAARVNFVDNFNVIEQMVENGNEEEKDLQIAALYADALFHQRGLIDNDTLDREDVHVYLDDYPPERVENELKNRIGEVRANGLSNESTKTLIAIINGHKQFSK